MSTKILIVEDNQDMRRGLEQFLQREGYLTQAVSSCEEGIDEVDERAYDAAIIDINLPGKSGFELIEYIRERGYQFPLIAMTARDGINDKVKGFELGLTDYIVKPFNLMELQARLHAHLKGHRNTSSDTIETTSFYLNPTGFEFKHQGQRVELTQLEFRIMHLLMQHNHQMVALDDLIEYVWGESETFSRPPIRIHIANLRKKIGDTNYTIIRTIPGAGYILNDPTD
jgi:DNA-binding response OmpR family regulator